MDYLRLFKILLYAVAIFISMILGLSFFISYFPEWKTYGYEYLIYNQEANNIMPLEIQTARAWSYIALIIFIFSAIFSYRQILKIEDQKVKKVLMWSMGVFSWALIHYVVYQIYKNRYYERIYYYFNQDRKESINILIKKDFYKNSSNLSYTFFSYLALLISFCAFIFIILPLFNIPNSRFNEEDPQRTYLFGELSFLTKQVNLIIFFFMAIFIFFNQKTIFKNNSILISICSYTLIVVIVYWTILFPSSSKVGLSNRYPNPYFLMTTIWYHAVNPLIFISFAIWTMFRNKMAPKSFLQLSLQDIVYPSIYGIYIYGLPFFSQFSPYGSLTNINPHSISYYKPTDNPAIEIAQESGSLWNILLIVIFGLFFLLSLFIFWFANKTIFKICEKKSLKTQ
ncbi:MAG: DUF1600 domain-containing protein [Mycoplasmoidaceae bacterium]